MKDVHVTIDAIHPWTNAWKPISEFEVCIELPHGADANKINYLALEVIIRKAVESMVKE